MIHISVYGRVGAVPIERKTRTGNPMVTVSVAVDVSRSGDTQDTEWFSVVAFGTMAEVLAKHQKGDLAAIAGQLCRTRFTGRDGHEKAGWSLTAESIVSARTVRPGTRRKTAPQSQNRRANGSAGLALPNDRVDDLWPVQ